MLKNYFKIAWRNLFKSKTSSIINISGLAVGMAVAILIGLWIYDELSFDRYHKNYDRIVQVMQHQTFNGQVGTQPANPAVMAGEIRRVHGHDFKYVLQSSWNFDHSLTYGDKILLKPGSFFEPQVTDMLSLKMLSGSKDGLKDMHSILLAQSTAIAIFGNEDPVGKVLKIDTDVDVKVTGVYEDLPDNTTFRDLKFILPWDLWIAQTEWVKNLQDQWGANMSQTFAQVKDNVDIAALSKKDKGCKI